MEEKPEPSFKFSQAKRRLLEQLLNQEGLLRDTALKIPPRPPEARVPLSFMQQSFWFLYQLEGAGPTYNLPFAFHLKGSLDAQRLVDGINYLVQRHEILRTTFSMLDGEPCQVIHEAFLVPFEIHDLSHILGGERADAVQKIIVEEGRTAFDLEGGPLLRVKILRLQSEEHVLFINLHHAVFDEWSAGIFFQELGAAYRALISGRQPDLPVPSIQYGDFAVWQRHAERQQALEGQLAYWKSKLHGSPFTLNLQSDFSRPARPSFRGANRAIPLPEEVVQALQSYSVGEHITPFAILLAVYFVLLSRFCTQDDICVGTPISNRRTPELQEIIGVFLNTVTIRARMDEEMTFRQFSHQIAEEIGQAIHNQDVPFDLLVREINPERDLSRHPIFQAAFAYHPLDTQLHHLPGLEVTPINADYGWAKFDLILDITERQDGLRARLEYSTDLFTAATAEGMLRRFKVLLEAALSNPDQRLARLPLMTSQERHKILEEWNSNWREYPKDKTVHQLFEEQAIRSPHATAVVFGEQKLSYQELNLKANQLAHTLNRAGIQAGDRVGFLLERSAEMVITMLAILKAGAAYVPLDIAYPLERLEHMIHDSRMAALVTMSRIPGLTFTRSIPILFLDEVFSRLQELDAHNLELPSAATGLAYVMYTSGSTGTPKGIAIPHRAIVRLVRNTDYLSIEAGDRIAQASNASFDAATFEVWGVLLNGACLVGLPHEILLTPPELAAFLRRQEITVLFLTTALFNQIAAITPQAFSSLNTLLFGGEAVSPRWVRRVLEAGPPGRLLHVYGPTENTTFSIWHLVDHVTEDAFTIPIGRPIANTQAYILDRCLEPVPASVPGELYLGGHGLADGYVGSKDLKADFFIPNPFALEGVEGSERLYKTGDLARYREDGNIEFLGRMDSQIKLRGFRVELGEIEAKLLDHPLVEQAVVLAHAMAGNLEIPDDLRLAAYVALRTGETVSSQELRLYLQSRLPDFMIPSAFIFLPTLPVTPNGKIDRRALPAPLFDDPKAELEEVSTELEKSLVEIWRRVLGVERLGVNDSFFSLGGHSLLAVRLFLEIEKETGQRLPLASLFQYPTVAKLAGFLQAQTGPRAWQALVPVQTGGSKTPFFCVHNFGGEVLNFGALANELGDDQPFFGFQARGLYGEEAPDQSIPLMASYYIRLMRLQQANGPYLLGGFCFGGVVAYEMACQLRAQGEAVALVAIFDGGVPGRKSQGGLLRRVRWVTNFLRNLPYWLFDFFALSREERRLSYQRRWRQVRKILRAWLGKPEAVEAMDLIAGHAATAPEPHQKVMEAHMQAFLDYQAPKFSGPVVLFRVRRMPLLQPDDPDYGWKQVVEREVKIELVRGGHHNMLQKPYVDELAARLSVYLGENSRKG